MCRAVAAAVAVQQAMAPLAVIRHAAEPVASSDSPTMGTCCHFSLNALPLATSVEAVVLQSSVAKKHSWRRALRHAVVVTSLP